jgi:hypothetical protein
MLTTISVKKNGLNYTILKISYDQETHGFKALCTNEGKLVELSSQDLNNCKLSSSKVILSAEK